MAAGEKLHLNERVVVRLTDDLVFQYRLLRPGFLSVVAVALVLLLVPHNPTLYRTLRILRTVLCQRPICLVHVARAEHVVESRQRLRRAGKYHQSAHGPVEPVHHSEKHVPRLGIRLFDVFLHGVRQRFVARLVALYNLAAALADDDYVVVFVDYDHFLMKN